MVTRDDDARSGKARLCAGDALASAAGDAARRVLRANAGGVVGFGEGGGGGLESWVDVALAGAVPGVCRAGGLVGVFWGGGGDGSMLAGVLRSVFAPGEAGCGDGFFARDEEEGWGEAVG